MALDEKHWFTESVAGEGVAFSLRIEEKLYVEQSPYQRIEIFETTHWGRLMVIDGCVMLTGRDNFLYHEMMAHPALFTHVGPRAVLIIGGGDCGTLQEVLRHPEVEQVVQVEIDERVTRIAERFFPELTASNKDPRCNLRFEDGVEFVRRAAEACFDVAIIDSTDPVGPAQNLFSCDFLRQIHRILRPGGVLAQQSESPLLHGQSILKPLHQSLAEAGFDCRATLSFPVPSYPSGWWSCTLAGKACDVRDFRHAAAAARPFSTRYYNADVHHGSLAVPGFCHGMFGD
ncbi:MAG TPA: polyamine aminopropyltransferase [Nitrococcus sp.]|nr:polyamine aminopropyltransferase [Nitrococcus sp.]